MGFGETRAARFGRRHVLKGGGDRHKAMEHYVTALRHSREARIPSTDPVVADTIKNVAAFQKC